MHGPDDPDHPDDAGVEGEVDAHNQERRRQKYLLLARRRNLRDHANPFDVTYEAFTKSYRLAQDTVFSVIALIRPFMRQNVSSLAVPLELKFLAVLSFYATGSYQRGTGSHFDCPLGQSTLSGFINEVTDALNEDEILARFIRFPATNQEINDCIDRNRNCGGKLDDVIAYTDGSLFKIRKPSLENNCQAFIGRKNFPCINAQITCDRRMYIFNVLARYPGSTSDSFIFEGSALRRRMIQIQENQRPRCYLLGDDGYVQEPWMLTPFGGRPDADSPEGRFNKIHCSDRNVVERAIGVLKERFRFLSDERVPHYDMKVCKFVNVGSVLHNICVLTNAPLDIDDGIQLANNNVNEEGPEVIEDDDEDDYDDPDVPMGRRNNAAVIAQGYRVRQEIVEYLEQRRH